MPTPDSGPNPQELAERKIDNLLEEHMHIADEGIPSSSLELVLADGAAKILPVDPGQRDTSTYTAYKTDLTNSPRANNIISVFSPRNRDSLNRELEQLRQLGEGQEAAAQEIVTGGAQDRQNALYFLAKKGYLRQTLHKLGPDKAERMLKMSAAEAEVDYLNPETLRNMSTPEYQEKQRDFQKILKEIYVILFELGLDAAAWDK
jgi:hypothetical protein